VLAQAINGLVTPEGTIDASGPLNALVVHDKTDNVRSMATVLKQLDQPVNQLLVEARVLEVTLDNDLETEIQHLLVTSPGSFMQTSNLVDLHTPGATPTEGQGTNIRIRAFGGSEVQLNSFFRFLLSRGKARILSSPNLIVSPGTESSIITGEEVPIQSITTVGTSQTTTTQFKRVGIKLRVNLLQLTNDTARLELNPEVSTVTRFITSGSGGVGTEVSNPIVAIRNVTSTLSLRDGEILTVGGLLSTEDRTNTRGVPILQDIPVLGVLFRSKRDQQVRTQVVFLIRVHILAAGGVDEIRLLKPDGGMKPLDPYMTPPPATTMPTKPSLNRFGGSR
jgi:general secretion pathway protein D